MDSSPVTAALNSNAAVAAAAAAVGVPGAAPVGNGFSVAAVRGMLFERLPDDLRAHVAFRHFYTDDLDPKASDLSLRFFCLCIAYFCALCRLEGRRKHYLQSPSEKSGASFARAHFRARHVFLRLNATYGEILLKYNSHSQLSFPKKPRVVSRNGTMQAVFDEPAAGGQYAIGAKPMGPPMQKQRAFEFFADELRFYEELYVFTEQILRRAFTDERLQAPIAAEINLLFRGERFNFGELRREADVRRTTRTMGASEPGGELRQNMRRLAEVLIAPAPRVSIKEAAVQRTPLVACRFKSGKMNARRYERPETALSLGGVAALRPPSSQPRGRSPQRGGRSGSMALANSTMGSTDGNPAAAASSASPIMFPPDHRAVAQYLARRAPGRPRVARSAGTTPSYGTPSALGPTGDYSATNGAPQHAFLPKLQDYDVPDAPGGESTPRSPQTGVSSPSPAPAMDPALGQMDQSVMLSGSFTVRMERPSALKTVAAEAGSRAASRADLRSEDTPGKDGVTSPSKLRAKVSVMQTAGRVRRTKSSVLRNQPANDEVQIAPVDPDTGIENWRAYDPSAEIDKVYQSLANGVVISTLAIPSDLLCVYDGTGVLLSTGD